MPLRSIITTTADPRALPSRRALLPALVLSALAAPAARAADPVASGADPVSFSASFFPAGAAPKMDLSRFEKDGYVPPGTYRGDVLVNTAWRARTDIVFAAMPDAGGSQPCYDAAALARYGIDLAKVAADTTHAERRAIPTGVFCGAIGDYIPDAAASFDGGEQALSLSVPQVYMQRDARGYVDPSQWDAGIDAGVLAYTANFYRNDARGHARTSGYLGLNASLNLGSWHAYHLGSLNWVEGGGKRYQNSATYVQHDLPDWRAQLIVGDTFTSGELFDSVRLRGVRVYTDDRMLPQSLRGYAPVVRGVAETNAHVVIRQNGYIVYDTTVAPGPFVVDDLYPTGYGGDLEVEIAEADGRVRRFSQPFSAVPQLLRTGQERWSVAAGRVSQLNMEHSPVIFQATYQRGLSNMVTAYGGTTLGAGYRSVLGGAALNTTIGAFSTDITQARNRLPGQSSSSGYSVRVGYNKNLVDTGTNFGIAAYRYSTSGFVSLSDAVLLRDADARGYANTVPRQRSRMDVTLNQSLGDRYGQLYLTGSRRDFWRSRGHQLDFTAGYSHRWRSFNYNLSVQRSRDSLVQRLPGQGFVDRIPGLPDALDPVSALPGRRDTRFFLSVSVPLGRTDKAPLLTALANRSRAGGDSTQLSLSGAAGEEKRFAYGATLGHSGGDSTLALNGQYNGSRTHLNASYSQGSGYKQAGAGATGSVVVHGGGMTFSPPTGDTIGLIHAPHAAGARVTGGQGPVVDKRGYAVAPYLMPYQLNTVELDPKGAAANVELKTTTQSVAPRAGSVVRLSYQVDDRSLLMIDTHLPDGRPVPFGAEVLDDAGNNIGVVGQASRVFVRGMKRSGVVTVKWAEGESGACRIHVLLPQRSKGDDSALQAIQAACAAGQSVVDQAKEAAVVKHESMRVIRARASSPVPSGNRLSHRQLAGSPVRAAR